MNDLDIDTIAKLATDECEAYRAGYLAEMAAAGLTPGDVDTALEKRAFDIGSLFDKSKSLATMVLVGLPLSLGGVAGWAAANATNPGKEDIEILENESLANEYRRQTAALRGEIELARRRTGRRKARSIGL